MRRIVVGYDGSEAAGRALERAAELACGKPDVEVTVVTASPLLPLGPALLGEPDVEPAEELKRTVAEARLLLGERGVAVHTVDAVGDPTSAILQAAANAEADLVIVGTRGRNVLARALLGSVSTQVVHQAHCDVLVVR
jgi:nucleotide-binding universal stress UspA family protein